MLFHVKIELHQVTCFESSNEKTSPHKMHVQND